MIILMIIGMAIITFSIRFFSIFYSDKILINKSTNKFFSLIPVAVLSSICAPLIFVSDNKIVNPFFSLEFWTCVVAIFLLKFGSFVSVILSLIFYFIIFFFRDYFFTFF